MLNKTDIKILHALLKDDCTSQIKSYTIQKLTGCTGIKSGKLRYTLRSLILGEYVGEGLQTGSANTFYITNKGKEALREVLR